MVRCAFFPLTKFLFLPKRFLFFLGKVLARQHVMHRVTLGTRHKGECSRKVNSVTSVVSLDLIRLDSLIM